MLTHCQARWSEYLSAFNLTIRFCPSKLGAKPNTLTRHLDVYPKGGDKDYSSSNPQNYRPVFSEEQLTTSLCATALEPIVDQAFEMIDTGRLHSDILKVLKLDKHAQNILSSLIPPNSQYSIAPSVLNTSAAREMSERTVRIFRPLLDAPYIRDRYNGNHTNNRSGHN